MTITASSKSNHAPARTEVLEYTAERISAIDGRRIIVAIDGVDGSGKTNFADELAPLIRARGRHVVRAGVDGFHHPRRIRYRRGRDSPDGFFRDSYDYDALKRDLLAPFRAGERGVRTVRFDHRTDRPVPSPPLAVDETSTLILDGIFLHRDELAGWWDMSIYLDVPFSVSYARMAARDGSDPDPGAPSNRRYLEGQRLYLRHCAPLERASLVIDNRLIEAPRVVRAP
ncbi:MAG: uridine kinase [Rhizobiaceae bacterium]|nr:uridine kinase [Rhizobiaceae bacterium]MCV0407207.1 uridine kinase [Rhizobiaceae bacterium]